MVSFSPVFGFSCKFWGPRLRVFISCCLSHFFKWIFNRFCGVLSHCWQFSPDIVAPEVNIGILREADFLDGFSETENTDVDAEHFCDAQDATYIQAALLYHLFRLTVFGVQPLCSCLPG